MDFFKDKLYRCFNQDLKWYLLERGYHFLLVAQDCNSGDKFWLFEKTNDLLKSVQEYKNFKYKG